MQPFAPHVVTLRQLQYLVAVVDSGSFSRAAQWCGVSQPSLSAAIAQAEDALGLLLLDRTLRPVQPTRAGEPVLEQARAALLAADNVTRTAAQLRDPLAGTLRVGVIPTLAPYVLPTTTAVVAGALPKLQLHWQEDRTGHLVAAVLRGQLDAALLALEADLGGLATAPLGWDGFVAALAATDPRAQAAVVSPAALDAGPLLLLEEGHCLRDQALAWCSRASLRADALRATSLATLTQMVAAGAGATLLPQLAVSLENRAQQLAIRPLDGLQPGRWIGLAFRDQPPLAGAVRQLAAVLRAGWQDAGLVAAGPPA